MIRDALAALGVEGATTRPVHGGDIHEAWRVDPSDGPPVFVKTNARPLPRVFELEADGLRALRAAAPPTVGVPEVLGFGDHWLALSWIEQGRRRDDAGRLLGEGLAAVHRHTSPTFGWPEDNWIGSLPQPNGPLTDGVAFFAERRLQEQARTQPASVRRAVDAVCRRLPDLLPDEPPALVHGDLWGGNWTAGADGRPWIYDPAVHYGFREAELAFTRLFGGFPASFHEAYATVLPLENGFDDRIDLWNLYPLLVHANLFGGGYGARAEGIARRYA